MEYNTAETHLNIRLAQLLGCDNKHHESSGCLHTYFDNYQINQI